MRNEDQSSLYCLADRDLPMLSYGMVRMGVCGRIGIQEDARRFLERHPVFPEVRRRFSVVPLKGHVTRVYRMVLQPTEGLVRGMKAISLGHPVESAGGA